MEKREGYIEVNKAMLQALFTLKESTQKGRLWNAVMGCRLYGTMVDWEAIANGNKKGLRDDIEYFRKNWDTYLRRMSTGLKNAIERIKNSESTSSQLQVNSESTSSQLQVNSESNAEQLANENQQVTADYPSPQIIKEINNKELNNKNNYSKEKEKMEFLYSCQYKKIQLRIYERGSNMYEWLGSMWQRSGDQTQDYSVAISFFLTYQAQCEKEDKTEVVEAAKKFANTVAIITSMGVDLKEAVRFLNEEGIKNHHAADIVKTVCAYNFLQKWEYFKGKMQPIEYIKNGVSKK